MKNKYLIIAIIGMLTLSCNQPNKKSNDKIDQKQIEQDSTTLLNIEKKKREKKKRDSILIIEQNKVIGEIRFGMTKNEVNTMIKRFRKKNRRPDKFLGKPYYDDFIGEYEYFQMTGFYDEGKLYELYIQGVLTDWEDFDRDVSRQTKYISNVIKQKYGEPDLHYDIEPRYKLNKGYSYLISRWIVGTKTIEVRLQDNGTNYPINVSIFLPEVRKKIENKKNQEEKESTEKAKDVF